MSKAFVRLTKVDYDTGLFQKATLIQRTVLVNLDQVVYVITNPNSDIPGSRLVFGRGWIDVIEDLNDITRKAEDVR